MRAYDYDLVIIGAGPGGVASAKVAALRGLKVGLVCDDALLGYGLSGAYKSKAMYEMAQESYAVKRRWGYDAFAGGVNFAEITASNNLQAEELRCVYTGQFTSLGIEILPGYGTFLDPHTIDVSGKPITAEHIIISTGTRPRVLPDMKIDGRHMLTSDEIVTIDRRFKSLLILGAGVIGCEFASIFAAFGLDVILVDTKDTILSHEDADISALLARSMKTLNIDVCSSARSKGFELVGDQVVTDLGDKGKHTTDAVLLAIGRLPNTGGLKLEAAGVELNEWGYIGVSCDLQTNVEHIYAVGDVGKRDTHLDLCLVHVAEAEGRHAVSHILEKKEKPISTRHVPYIIFSLPMIAGAGDNEKNCREKYGDVRVGKFANCRNHRSHAMRSRSGFVKLIVGPDGDDRVLGVRGVGKDVDDVVGEVSLMIEHDLPYTHLLDSIHAHPSLSESLQGAARIIAGDAPPYCEGEELALGENDAF